VEVAGEKNMEEPRKRKGEIRENKMQVQ